MRLVTREAEVVRVVTQDPAGPVVARGPAVPVVTPEPRRGYHTTPEPRRGYHTTPATLV